MVSLSFESLEEIEGILKEEFFVSTYDSSFLILIFLRFLIGGLRFPKEFFGQT